ncbi:hypothetical protein BGX33_010922 [Mortierella sp. NVP41]|nr:hypothetical protein BGX33_010922 [Mortierella sp. NVP41]
MSQQHQQAHRVVSHWAKSTPEEGIQLIFNQPDTDKATDTGVRILTLPTSTERPCQWDISLRLAHPPSSSLTHSSSSAEASLGNRHTTTAAPQSSRTAPSSQQPPPLASASTPYPRSNSPLLILTLQRASIRLTSAGIVGGGGGEGTAGANNMSFEDPMNPSRARCDSYRTIYIYSPKLRRDIHVQTINRDLWPQIVVFSSADVVEDNHEYHFQIWLSGSSPRQMDVRTATRMTQQQDLLFAMRHDTATCNVQITIKDHLPFPSASASPQECYETELGLGKQRGHGHGHSGTHPIGGDYNQEQFNTSTATNDKYDNIKNTTTHASKLHDSSNYMVETIRATFWAHKTILESVPFFSRMLSGRFKEGQQGADGMHRISLSSDMFDPKIMGPLLDYIYTREPIQDDGAIDDNDGNGINPYSWEDYGSLNEAPTMGRRHVESANVALNLQTIVAEPSPRHRPPNPTPYSQPPTVMTTAALPASSWLPTPASSSSSYNVPLAEQQRTPCARKKLKPEDWFLLYRAAIHLEDAALQVQALEKIQAQLSVQSALEKALTWGPGYPEIKRVVLSYVFNERRAIFGDEERNQLRPYLWPEIEDQVDVLVEITSKIARQ